MPQCQLPVLCCFWFQKNYIGNILGIGWDENPASYFTVTYMESEGEKEGSHEAPTPCPRAAEGGHAAMWCGGLVALLLLPFGLRVRDGKIGGWVSSRPIPRIFHV